MKTLKKYTTLFMTVGLIWLVCSSGNDAPKTTLELLKGRWAQPPHHDPNRLWAIQSFTNSRIQDIIIYKNDTIAIDYSSFYLSNTMDTLFQKEKIGSKYGSFIIQQRTHPRERYPSVKVYQIFKITPDTLILAHRPRTTWIGPRPNVYTRLK